VASDKRNQRPPSGHFIGDACKGGHLDYAQHPDLLEKVMNKSPDDLLREVTREALRFICLHDNDPLADCMNAVCKRRRALVTRALEVAGKVGEIRQEQRICYDCHTRRPCSMRDRLLRELADA